MKASEYKSKIKTFELPEHCKCNPDWAVKLLCDKTQFDSDYLAEAFLKNIKKEIKVNNNREELLKHFYLLNQCLCISGFAQCLLKRSESYPEIIDYLIPSKIK